ncbi:MAG: hypothetical protein H6610_06945 [Ignavibacteriales bacterium]|nr:hypothetical protein [Ignavibacteriales bacterium]MCB9219177.1 hypothetical protein [Ignavibacteriales bacterium]
MVRFFKILFLIFFISVVSTFGQNIRVTASTDTSDYLVGDYINFTIKVEFDEGIRISPPSLTDKLGMLEVIKVLPLTAEKENNIQQFNYILSGYDSARVVIPPIPITYFNGNSSEPQTIETNEVVVFIHTLEVIPNSDIKDVKAPIRIPFDWLFWGIVLLVILLLASIGYFLYKKFKKPEDEVRIIRRTPPIPIHIIALKSLDKLKEKKLWQQGKVKEYHSEITEIIRKYFEDRYHFNSLEMTTAESMIVLNRVMDNQKIIDLTGKFLANADMVKFAKFVPIPSVNEEMMIQAYEIIDKTKPDEEPLGVSRAQ